MNLPGLQVGFKIGELVAKKQHADTRGRVNTDLLYSRGEQVRLVAR